MLTALLSNGTNVSMRYPDQRVRAEGDLTSGSHPNLGKGGRAWNTPFSNLAINGCCPMDTLSTGAYIEAIADPYEFNYLY